MTMKLHGSFLIGVKTGPVNTCQLQSECLKVTTSDCDSNGDVTVCLSWEAGMGCAKERGDAISHVCVASK